MDITYIKKINSSSVLHKTITTFNIPQLTTKIVNKYDAPAWNFTTMKARTLPTKINGFIIDFDSFKKPKLNVKYTYFLHQTHNKKWRIIIPFEKNHAFSNAADYKSEHYRMMSLLFDEGLTIEQLLIDPKDTEKPYVDPKSFTPTQFYFLRPSQHSLIENKGEFFKPKFLKFNRGSEFKPVFSKSFKINDDQKCSTVLSRMADFYDYYKSTINFKYILQPKHRCLVCADLDDAPNDGELQLNNGNMSFVGNIQCHHVKCRERLEKMLCNYMPIDPVTKQMRRIRNYTVLYLAYGIIKGKLSIDQVEACGYHYNLQMMINKNDLRYLTFNAKKDTPMWLKILHEGIIWRPHDGEDLFYYYEKGYYKATSKAVLVAQYHDTAGTYAAYRCDKLNPKEYVLRLAEFGKGRMLENYKQLVVPDGISLKNGNFIWGRNGVYEFNSPSPNVFYNYQLDFNYDEKAKCPLWMKTLKDYFDDENSLQAKVLQEFFGYCLTYDRRFEKLLIMFGVTGGGKNTITSILRSLVPEETSTMRLLCSVKDNQFIIDKKLIVVNESIGKFGEHTMNTLKKMSSSDPVQVRPLYGAAFSLEQVPKIVILFNNAPDTMKIDSALRARMLTIKLVKGFRNKATTNINLIEMLKEELSGIFNWALEGYIRLYAQKGFTTFTRDTDELYHDANEARDDILKFLHTLKIREDKWASIDLYYEYMQAFEGEELLTQNQFSRTITLLGGRKVRKGTQRGFDLGRIWKLENE